METMHFLIIIHLMEIGLFTWPNQDVRINMTEIREHDRKVDNDER